jgi:hypothetical protein
MGKEQNIPVEVEISDADYYEKAFNRFLQETC